MKICIVTPGFGETTIPFAQHLKEAGHSCEVFVLSLQGRTNCGTLEFDSPIYGTSIYLLDKKNNIYEYLNKDINIYNVPYLLEKNKKYLVGFFAYFKNLIIAKKLASRIKTNSYDVVFVVAHEMMDAMVCEALKKYDIKNVYIAYHEVLNSHFGTPALRDVVKRTKVLGYPLVTYSKHNKIILEKFVKKQANTLYFGPFETYRLYDTSVRLISFDYILFIGNIQPYKGLSFLYDTMAHQESVLPFKIVVAGSGNDEVLDKIRTDDRFILINRYLSDTEFANLTRYAKCVICPYKAGSQSGITHTAMVYGTPVIATNVAAFPEFIYQGENGSLVKYRDHDKLIKEIMCYASSNKRNVSIPEHLRWDNIILSFEDMVMRQNKCISY